MFSEIFTLYFLYAVQIAVKLIFMMDQSHVLACFSWVRLIAAFCCVNILTYHTRLAVGAPGGPSVIYISGNCLLWVSLLHMLSTLLPFCPGDGWLLCSNGMSDLYCSQGSVILLSSLDFFFLPIYGHWARVDCDIVLFRLREQIMFNVAWCEVFCEDVGWPFWEG